MDADLPGRLTNVARSREEGWLVGMLVRTDRAE
jgi:hypothetical protein